MTKAATAQGVVTHDGITAPLRHATFRRIWLASLLSNLGIMIQGVGAAWAMTQMTSSADWVALVQTALNLPIMLTAMPAGAIADMHERRIVVLVSLGIALAGATGLTIFTWMNWLTPINLLALCFVVGTGMALMAPAWQSSVSEQVPVEILTSAVALNSISYNIARSLGPAIGGIVVATAGAVAAFGLNAVLFFPLIVALLLWKRNLDPSPLPPEKLIRAIVTGVRYVMHSPSMKVLLTRSMVTGVVSGAITALMPLVARDLLHGGAQTYGVMLSAFGMGAVFGALNINRVRNRMSVEAAIRISALSMGGAVALVAVSRVPVLTALALVVAGAAWITTWALFNICVQLSVPRWVTGRALSAYQAAGWGGFAIGSWGWGHLADGAGVRMTLLLSATLITCSAFIGLWLRMPRVASKGEESEGMEHPKVRLPLTERSGP
ncbi:MAG: MFS transporter, partial [Pyrinomonadaceae bacterium]